MKLSEWIKSARTHKRLTQAELGARIGLTKGNISAWENDRHEPSFKQLQAIAELTGYPLLEPETAQPSLGRADFDIFTALRYLSDALMRVDDLDRRMALPLLSELAMNPGDVDKIAVRLASTLHIDQKARPQKSGSTKWMADINPTRTGTAPPLNPEGFRRRSTDEKGSQAEGEE